MKNPFRRMTIILGLSLCSAFVNATPIEFVPSDQTVGLGSQVSVDIVVTPDDGALISAFDFIVSYDSSILSFSSVVFGGLLGGDIFASLQFDELIPGDGMLNLSELSFLFDSELDELQNTSSFVLATIFFGTLDAGTSLLGLSFGDSGFLVGAQFSPLAAELGTGSITVVSVPEPPTWLLFIAGLLAVSFHRSKFHLNKTN